MDKAVIDTQTNLVDNIITEPDATWTPPEGHIVVDLIDGAGIGWAYVNGQFIAPPPQSPPSEQRRLIHPSEEIPVTQT